MAAIPAANTKRLYDDNGLRKVSLFRLVGVNTGDTIDVGGAWGFRKVERVTAYNTTLVTVASVVVGVTTVVTLTLVGMANETVDLHVVGQGL